MDENLRIGIVGAGGWLGGAFAAALVETGVARPEALTLSFRSKRPDILPRARWTADNQDLFDRSDVVIVSVRPQDFPALTPDTHGKLVISVMAGIPLDRLGERFRTDRVVRSLPNGAAEVGKSYTPWVASGGIGAEDRALVRRILESCGAADEVPGEEAIDYLTGLTGSGPAFPALLASAMMHDAIDRGFAPEVARKAVIALLVGTGRLLEGRADCPDDIVRTFMGYRGTTAAALDAMRHAGFESAVRDGLAAALEKSVSMGRAS
jgi:pyrroline-5-carboxylate reductase